MMTRAQCLSKTYLRVLGLLLIVQLSACGVNNNATLSTQDNTGSGGIAIPLAIATALPSNGSLAAYLRIDGGARYPMKITGDTASVTLDNLTPGAHTLTVEFEFTSDTNLNTPLMLARGIKIINLVAGNNGVNFSDIVYDTNFDYDLDGLSNLKELADNTDPFVTTAHQLPVVKLDINTSSDIAENGGAATLTASLVDPKTGLATTSSTLVTVHLAYNLDATDTAVAGVDYTKVTNDVIVIPVGMSFKQVNITAIDDQEVEGRESLTIDVDNVENAVEVTAQRIMANIADDDLGVKVNVSGYTTGNSMVLQNNGGDDLSITNDGLYTFKTPVPDTTGYDVTIKNPAQIKTSCDVVSGKGTIQGQNVTLQVNCSDNIAPNIIATSPAANSTVADAAAPINVTFDEAMFANTITSGTLALVDQFTGGAVGISAVSFDNVTRIASYSPNSRLALLRDYTASLASTITDVSGINLNLAGSPWSFTTRDGVWATTMDTVSNKNATEKPFLASNASDNLMAIWANYDGSKYNIWANRYVASTGNWGTAQLVSDGVNSTGYKPTVAMDPMGNAVAVWRQNDLANPASHIMWSRYTWSTDKWTTPQVIDTSNTSLYVDMPRIVLDQNGDGIAVWKYSDFSLWYSRFTAGSGSWTTPTSLDTSVNYNGNIDLAMDSAGNAMAVYLKLTNAGTVNVAYSLSSRYYTATTKLWAGAKLVETVDPGDAGNPHVKFIAVGSAVAMWDQTPDSANYDVYMNRYTGGTAGTWGARKIVNTLVGGGNLLVINRYPEFGIDTAGNIIAVWYDMTGTSTLKANRYDVKSDAWNTTQSSIPLPGTSNNIDLPLIAVGPQGNAIAIVSDATGTTSDMVAARYKAKTNSWSNGVPLESDSVNSANGPGIFIDRNGYGIAIWNQVGTGVVSKKFQ